MDFYNLGNVKVFDVDKFFRELDKVEEEMLKMEERIKDLEEENEDLKTQNHLLEVKVFELQSEKVDIVVKAKDSN